MTRKIIYFAIYAYFAMACGQADAADYHVTTGPDLVLKAAKAKPGDIVYLDADVVVTQSVKFKASGVSMLGQNHTLTATGTTWNAVQCENPDANNRTPVVIRDLSIIGGKIGVASYNVQVRYENITVWNTYSHGWFFGGSTGTSGTVTHCMSMMAGRSGRGAGFRIGDRGGHCSWNMTFTDCYAEGSGTLDDGETATGFNANSPQDFPPGATHDITLIRCRAYANLSSGISEQGIEKYILIDCEAFRNGGSRRGERNAVRLYGGSGHRIERGSYSGAGIGIRLETNTQATLVQPVKVAGNPPIRVSDGAVLIIEGNEND